MRYEWGDQPPLLTVAAGVCLIVFLVSFCTGFYATLVIIGTLAERADERELKWSERGARQISRFGQFLLADEYRSLRRRYFGAWAGTLGSVGVFALLMFLFGRPA
jgi:hypothetical protein